LKKLIQKEMELYQSYKTDSDIKIKNLEEDNAKLREEVAEIK